MQISNVVLVLVAAGALAANLVLDRLAWSIARAIGRLHVRRSVEAPTPVPCTRGCP